MKTTDMLEEVTNTTVNNYYLDYWNRYNIIVLAHTRPWINELKLEIRTLLRNRVPTNDFEFGCTYREPWRFPGFYVYFFTIHGEEDLPIQTKGLLNKPFLIYEENSIWS